MSNVIPIVSSSPPPLDDEEGFKWDDDNDDDEYGHFTSAATISTTKTNNHNISLNWSNSETLVSDHIPSTESSHLQSSSDISLEKSVKPISDFGDRSSPAVDSVYVSTLKLSLDGDKADENDDEFQDFAHFENKEYSKDSSPFSEKDPDSKFDESEVKNFSKFDESEGRTHKKNDVISSEVDKDDFGSVSEFNNIITDDQSVELDDSSVQLDNEEQLNYSLSSSEHLVSHIPSVHDHVSENCVSEKESSDLNHTKNAESIYSCASTVDSGVFSTDLSPSFHPEVLDSNNMFNKDSSSTNVASLHDDLASSTYAESPAAAPELKQVKAGGELGESVSDIGSRPPEAGYSDTSFISKAARQLEDIHIIDSENSSDFVSTISHSGVTDSEPSERLNPEANTHHINQELVHPADLTNSLTATSPSLVLNRLSPTDTQTSVNCCPSSNVDTINDAVEHSLDKNILLTSNSNLSDLGTHVECNINRSVMSDDVVQCSSRSGVEELTSQDLFSTLGKPNQNLEVNDDECHEEDKEFGDFSTFGNHISDEEQDIAPITFRTSLCEPDHDESLNDFVVDKEQPPLSEDDSDEFTDFDSAKHIDAVCVSEKEEQDDDFGDFDSALHVPAEVVVGVDQGELNESDEFGDFHQPETPEGGDAGWADFEVATPTTLGKVEGSQPFVTQPVPAPATTELSKAEKLHKALLGCFPEFLDTEQEGEERYVQVNRQVPVLPETASGKPGQRSLKMDTDPLPLDMIVNLGLSNPLEAQQQTWTVVEHPAKKDPKVRTWSHLKDVDSCHALSFSWPTSQCSRQVFTTLHIDTQNILFTHKKQAVPFFTSGLGILEPVRGGGGGIGVADRKKDKNSLSSGVATLNNKKVDTLQSLPPQQDLPAVDFDWSSSGLTNPLTDLDFLVIQGSDSFEKTPDEWDWVFKVDNQEVSSTPLQPLEDILKKTTPTVRLTSSEVLSQEALQVLQKMPDLTFMQSRVLMFPVKQ